MKHDWTKIDSWTLEDDANGASLMIVSNETGARYLLAARRRHPALPATWGEVVRLLPDDTRATLEADAGRVCPMPVWVCALEGYDDDRPIVFEWPDALVRNIANAAH